MYGIHQGNGSNQHEQKPQNAVIATQEDLAAKLGMSVDALQRYKALADMIPELDDMVRDYNRDMLKTGCRLSTTFFMKMVHFKNWLYNIGK